METKQEENLDEQYYRDSNWVAYNGGFIHSNNVLFYFAQSPFFDRQSSNSSVFQQALSDARFAHWLNTRDSFEAQLRRLSGLEYVVAYDPLAMNVQIDAPGPNGAKEFSNVWVVKKQQRAKRAGQEDQVTVLAFYYVVGDAIYQAPSVAKIMMNRMLSTVTSLTKMLAAAAPLPVFGPAYGHTYFPPVETQTHAQQQPTQMTGDLSRQSKETTPMPGVSQPDASSQKSTKNHHPDTHHSSDFQDTRTLLEAINMSLRYGKEYMDETPLVGEPGNFRLSKTKDPVVPPAGGRASQAAQLASQNTSPKQVSPAPSLPPPLPAPPPPPPPPIQTDVPPAAGKKSAKGTDKSPATPGSSQKAKRRKSKAAINVPGREEA